MPKEGLGKGETSLATKAYIILTKLVTKTPSERPRYAQYVKASMDMYMVVLDLCCNCVFIFLATEFCYDIQGLTQGQTSKKQFFCKIVYGLSIFTESVILNVCLGSECASDIQSIQTS